MFGAESGLCAGVPEIEVHSVGLDAGTLITALVVVCSVLAGLLALTWLQNRSVRAFGIWTVCFFLCAIAAAIVGMRDWLPGLLAFDIANVFRLLAFGMAWQAARYFTDGRSNWPLALAPTALWIVAWATILADGDLRQRILITTPLIAAYALSMAGELWRASAPGRFGVMRLAAALAAIHGIAFAARFFIALRMPESVVSAELGLAAPLHPINILEALAAGVAFAFLLLSITKEAIGEQHREAALLDPLTGVGNRRGFTDEVGRMLSRAERSGAWTALILLDLDRFKAINDSWGHPTGDHLLRVLTETTRRVLRPGDVIGRLGGDEFAIALADSRIDQALVLAERIRRAVAAMRIERVGGEIRFTVSVGVASLREAPSLDLLFGEADAALYRAKARGGNRVEFIAEVLVGPRADEEPVPTPRIQRVA
jgi:diguanylate cyclase (GGDEF)-like protein